MKLAGSSATQSSAENKESEWRKNKAGCQIAVETSENLWHLLGSLRMKRWSTQFNVIHYCLFSMLLQLKGPLKQSHSIAKTKPPNPMKCIQLLGQSEKESLFTSPQAENSNIHLNLTINWCNGLDGKKVTALSKAQNYQWPVLKA